MSIPSTAIICIKAALYRDLVFEAIHDELISRVLNILEKNAAEAEIDENDNRMFYLSEVLWYGEAVDKFVQLIKRRPDDYIFYEDVWGYPDSNRYHGMWNDSPWNPGWDSECGISFLLIE